MGVLFKGDYLLQCVGWLINGVLFKGDYSLHTVLVD